MDSKWKKTIWQQFGAAIDMLQNAIEHCPDNLWGDRSKHHEFWYVTYHTLFWLDLYLSGAVEGYHPPEPYTLGELDPAGALPDRVYTRDEMKTYLHHCRKKCRERIDALNAEQADRICRFPWGEVSYSELLLYNMRHVQHHAAQLYLILRQEIDSAPRWVCLARE